MGARSRRARRLAESAELGDFIKSLRRQEAACDSNWWSRHDSDEDRSVWLVTPLSHGNRRENAMDDVNYEVAQEMLESASCFTEPVTTGWTTTGPSGFRLPLRMSRWTWSGGTSTRSDAWPGGVIETILVRTDDAGALRCLRNIIDALENYPVLDETRFSEREHEDNHPSDRECYATDEDGNYRDDDTPARCCDEALRRQLAARHRKNYRYHVSLVPNDGEIWCETCDAWVDTENIIVGSWSS